MYFDLSNYYLDFSHSINYNLNNTAEGTNLKSKNPEYRTNNTKVNELVKYIAWSEEAQRQTKRTSTRTWVLLTLNNFSTFAIISIVYFS
jgi:cytochrome c1